MSEVVTESPVAEIAAQAPKPEQPRAEGGRFAAKPAEPAINTPIKNAQEDTRQIAEEALREAFGVRHPAESDKKALDEVKPKAKDQGAKTDSDKGSKPTGTTSKDKPESSSKDATRPADMAKARKALELEGWTEEDLADIPDEKIAALGKKAGEKHARIAREKREAAEAAKKAPQVDPGSQKSGATASEVASEQDDDLSEYVKAAEEHFKGFEAETEEGTKAFRTAQAKFVKQAVDRVTARYEAKLSETVENLSRGIRGETALNRALDRIAIDIPQVDETDVRQKLTNRIAALASDPETAEELRTDIRAVVRREALALGLKDQKAERERTEREELRAAKDAGQPFTGHRDAGPEPEATGINLIQQELRRAFSKPG